MYSTPVAFQSNASGYLIENPGSILSPNLPTEERARFVLAAKPGSSDPPVAGSLANATGMARVVDYAESDIIPVRTRLRYTTLIRLPQDELIMDVVIGDKDNWVVNGAANIAYVKPAKVGAATNLSITSARNIVYSFILGEVGDGVPDLKIFVQGHDEAILLALKSPAKYVPADRVEDYRQQAELAKNQARDARQAAQSTAENRINEFKSTYPASVNSAYRFDRGKKPFDVTEIFNDGKFTYIKARPDETPTLYELKDGVPSLVAFDYRDGTYVVGKVLERGYLAIGKKRFEFAREQ